MRISFISKVTRVHKGTTAANDRSLWFTILAVFLGFHSGRPGWNGTDNKIRPGNRASPVTELTWRVPKLPHAEPHVILGCTVWMYAKLFHTKLCYLMLRCLTWPNTMTFQPRLTHLTSRWTVSLGSVPFHVRCSTIPSYPVSIVVILYHFMYRYPIWHHSSPVIITRCRLNSDR